MFFILLWLVVLAGPALAYAYSARRGRRAREVQAELVFRTIFSRGAASPRTCSGDRVTSRPRHVTARRPTQPRWRRSSTLALALDALNDWQFDWERRKDMGPIARPLIALLDHAKPTVAKNAARYLSNYLWPIGNGRAIGRVSVRVRV